MKHSLFLICFAILAACVSFSTQASIKRLALPANKDVQITLDPNTGDHDECDPNDDECLSSGPGAIDACLDENDNGVCDDEETVRPQAGECDPSVENCVQTTLDPNITDQGSAGPANDVNPIDACLDENDNGVCDDEEGAVHPEAGECDPSVENCGVIATVDPNMDDQGSAGPANDVNPIDACLDENDNGVCDDEEGAVHPEAGECDPSVENCGVIATVDPNFQTGGCDPADAECLASDPSIDACFDFNDNGICDNEEQTVPQAGECDPSVENCNVQTTLDPMTDPKDDEECDPEEDPECGADDSGDIDACLDENDNGVCDDEEKPETTPKPTPKTKSLAGKSDKQDKKSDEKPSEVVPADLEINTQDQLDKFLADVEKRARKFASKSSLFKNSEDIEAFVKSILDPIRDQLKTRIKTLKSSRRMNARTRHYRW